MKLPSTQEDWQLFWDDNFPEQLNVLIDYGDEDKDVDFSTPCVTVIAMSGELPTLLFWAGGIDKDFYLETSAVTVKQTDPRILIQIVTKDGRTFLFWPRPSGPDTEIEKTFNRSQALRWFVGSEATS